MGVLEILSSIDREIALLQRARVLLAEGGAVAPQKRRGRPGKSSAVAKPARKKRRLSAEGRRRIAEAVRRRWAAQKKASSGSSK